MNIDKLYKFAIVAWVIGAILSVLVAIGAIAVIAHFVLKFW